MIYNPFLKSAIFSDMSMADAIRKKRHDKTTVLKETVFM